MAIEAETSFDLQADSETEQVETHTTPTPPGTKQIFQSEYDAAIDRLDRYDIIPHELGTVSTENLTRPIQIDLGLFPEPQQLIIWRLPGMDNNGEVIIFEAHSTTRLIEQGIEIIPDSPIDEESLVHLSLFQKAREKVHNGVRAYMDSPIWKD